MGKKKTYEQLEKRIKELEQIVAENKLMEKSFIGTENIRQLLEFAPFGVFLIDLTGNVVAANRRGAERLGKTMDEVIGIHLNEYVPPDIAENRKLKGWKVIRSLEPVVFEDQIDGTRYLNTIYPILDDKGNITYLGVYGADITEIKQTEQALRQSETKYRELIEKATDPIYTVDMKGKFLEVNEAFLNEGGFSSEEIIGRNLTEIVHPDDEAVVIESSQRAKQGKPYQYELRARKKDGTFSWYSINNRPLILDDGSVGAVHGIARNIDERKRTEDALKESEEKYRFLAENMVDVVWMLDRNFRTTYVSSSVEKVFGFTPEERKQQTLDKMMTPESVHRVMEAFRRELRGDEEGTVDPDRSITIELEFYRKTGGTIWMESNVKAIRDAAGSIVGLHGVSRDTTDRRLAEQALRESESRYRSVFENAGTATVIMEENRIISMANPEFEKLSGYSKNEVEGKMKWTEFVVPEDLEKMKTYHKEIGEKEGMAPTEYEFRFIERKGDIKHIYNKVAVIPGTDKSVASLTDMTMRKRAGEALRESEEKFRNLAENSPNMIFINLKGRVVYANSKCEGLMGYGKDEFYSPDFDFMTLISPESREIVSEAFSKHMDGEELPPCEYTLMARDGSRIEGMVSTALIQYEGEKAILGVINDITDRKREEKERVLLNTAMEQAAEAIVITDTEGDIQYVNPAFERIAGYKKEEAIGNNPRILKSGKQGRAFYKDMWRTLTGGHTWSGHFINRKKDGTLYEEEATISPVLDSSGKIINYVAVKRDVTSEVKLEAQFRQAQKMEAIGTLAGGIAHDFNNLLQAIMGYTQMLMMIKEKKDPDLERLREIEKAALRAGELTQQLLAFSRKVESRLRPVDLNQEVRQVEKLLKRTIPKMISVELHLQEGLKIIHADPSQLEQVMMNMGVNARDAMPDGGKLLIETETVTLDEAYCKTHLGTVPGEYVLLTVSDTGRGMDKETLEHVFEPFFTTKETGKGTGLGLSMVYGIVKSHGGYIMGSSEPGKGTTFKIYFPAVEAGTLEHGEKPGKEKQMQGGRETILLVDDEKFLLDLGKEMLEKFGYTVITADRGESAIEIYQEKKEEIPLVVLDLIMPGMGGRRCLEGILKMDPSQKVIIVSGYYVDGPTKEALELGARGYIKKPYEVGAMLKSVREVLDQE